MRIATPSFQLFTMPLTQAVEQGKMQEIKSQIKKNEFMHGIKISGNDIPMALRWNMHPEFGFPRQSFNVYRRVSSYTGFKPVYIVSENIALTNTIRQFAFPQGQEMYISIVVVSLVAGQRIVITPFDREQKLMTGKSKTLTASGTAIFKCPFTAGFTITGTGIITSIGGIPMQQMLDAKDWELIQLVGLPFKKGTVGGQGYEGDDQGYIGALTDPETAARQRLKIGELLFVKPPSLSDATVPDPDWQAVGGDEYLNDLQNAPDSILEMIKDCLTNSDDFSFFRTKRQVAYVETKLIPGIHQAGGGSPKTAEAKIPVVGTTLLSISTESPAALGLGFGTTDFVSRTKLNGSTTTNTQKIVAERAVANPKPAFGYDYMVTAQYVIRPFETFDPLGGLFDDLSKKIEFCALSDERNLPLEAVNAEVFTLRTNRPEKIDLAFTESVKLRWDKTALPQGYGIVVSYKNGSSNVLNTEYDFFPKSYRNFNTFVPKSVSTDALEQPLPPEDELDNGRFVMVEPEEPLPFKGSEVHKYFIAGWDVFGQWSRFVRLNHVANAPAKQNPGVMGIHLSKTNPDNISDLSPTNPNVPSTLTLEIAWNWADRSPQEIQVTGTFFNASNVNPPVTHPNHFSLTSSDTSTPVIRITFDAAGNPSTTLGSVVNVINTAETPSDLRKIALTIDNMTSSFPAGLPYSVAYAVYVRGLEHVRALPLPQDFGDWSTGYVARMEDPRPPAITTLPASVQFTAMPDATKTGRGRLTWPVAANALGYYVWEASETAIRVALEGVLKAEHPADITQQLKPLTDSLVDRATQLRDLLAQDKYKNLCQRSFHKLSKEMITGTSVELEIPASSKVLTLYQVSSVNSANIESGKSNVVFFAVPQIQKPAAPTIMLRKFKREDPVTHAISRGIQVQVINGNGLTPAGFNLYRTRKLLLNNDVGMKGLPVKEYDDTDWQPYEMRMQDGTVYDGKYTEEVLLSGSWRPYVFQAVAVGQEDASRGFFRGESDASSTEVIYFPPDNNPTLLLLSAPLSNANSRVLKLSSSAPFDKIELGKTIIEVYQLDASNQRTLIKSFVASEATIDTVDLAPVTAAVAATWPAIKRKTTDIATGITQFSIGVASSVTKVIIRITDPLGRAAEVGDS